MARATAVVAVVAVLASFGAPCRAAVRDVGSMQSFAQLAAPAGGGPGELRRHQREAAGMIQRGEDAGALAYSKSLAVREPALAADLHESLAGAYLRDLRLYRATQHLDAIPAPRRSDQAWYLAGHIAARRQQLPAALEAFGRLVRRLPDDPQVARDEAQIASLLGQAGRAAAACERLLRSSPGDVEAMLLLARMRAQQGRLTDAERLSSEARARAPRHGRAALQLGLLQLALGKPAAARQTLAQARALELNSTSPYAALAAAALLAGDAGAARAAATGALKVNAVEPLAALLALLAADGAWPTAVRGGPRFVAASLYPDLETEPLAESVRRELATPEGRARLAVASVLSDLLSPRAALHWLAAEQLRGVQPLLEILTMRAEMAAGDARAAERRLDALLGSESARGLVGPALQAAIFASQRNDRAAARAAMQRALAVAPESPRLRMLAGDLNLALGEPARAVPDLRAALRGWPKDPRLLNQLAYALAQVGSVPEREEALRLAETGLGQRPHYLLRAALLDTRADLLWRLGRKAEAFAAYQELSTTVGGMTMPEQWHRLADLAHGAGNRALARTAYEEALDYGRDYPGRPQAVAALERQPDAGRK